MIAIPAAIIDDLTAHVATYAEPGPQGLVFVRENGGRLRNANFRRSVWRPAARAVGVAGLHFHDLRHTGNTLAAATGASTEELMARMGHSSMDAALRYQTRPATATPPSPPRCPSSSPRSDPLRRRHLRRRSNVRVR